VSVWASADAYERYIGRWSRIVADELLDRLDVPPGARWLDVGCGTGALSSTIRRHDPHGHVTGIDPSEAFVGHARAAVEGEFLVADARELPFADSTFDAVASGLVLNFVPEPERAAAEIVRVVRPGGAIGVYVWDYSEGMELIRHFFDAAIEVDPAAAEHDEGPRFAICHPGPLGELFRSAGARDVEVAPVDAPATFADFEDLWEPFLGGQGPAGAYAVSLDDAARRALRESLRRRLPIAADGSIRLTLRAWAATCTK
jgi:SAM-dependent methyltransferase